MGKVNKIDVA